jgi:type IV fimbrial biogenesis protein FimT
VPHCSGEIAAPQAGYTLPELIATLMIVALLASIAAPSFIQLRQNAERTAAVNGFLHTLYRARSEAIMRSSVVSLCKSLDGSSCAHRAANWSGGWILFVNKDRDEPPQRDDGEELIAQGPGWTRGTITSNRVAFTFRPVTQTTVNGTFVFCDERGSAAARAIIISHTGRPRVASVDSDNRPLRCAARSP